MENKPIRIRLRAVKIKDKGLSCCIRIEDVDSVFNINKHRTIHGTHPYLNGFVVHRSKKQHNVYYIPFYIHVSCKHKIGEWKERIKIHYSNTLVVLKNKRKVNAI